MGVELLTDRYKPKIAGILPCYDRIIALTRGRTPRRYLQHGLGADEKEHLSTSLAPLRELLLAFISTIEDDQTGTNKLNKISQPAVEE